MPKKIKAKAPKNLETALKYLQTGDIQSAAAACRKILHKNPNHAGALHLFGKVLLHSSQLNEAIQYISKAISITPHNSQYHYDLGLVLLNTGRLNEAIESFKNTLNLKSDHTDALFMLGSLLINKGEMNEAALYLTKAIELKPAFAEAYNNLGVISESFKKPDIAIQHYTKALSINPNYADAHNNLGNVFKETGMQDKAILHYEKALSINPVYADAHNNLANILKEKGMIESAAVHYRKALSIRPDYAEAHNNLGIVLKEMEIPDEAIKHFRQALKIRPAYAEAHNHIGNILNAMNMPDDAADHFRKALQIKPDYANAQVNMALFFLLKGDFQNGWEKYEWRLISDRPSVKTCPLPGWNGSPLRGKTLLILTEQGIGDEIMFASCLNDLLPFRGKYIMECSKRLAPLFKRSFPNFTFISGIIDDEHDTNRFPEANFKISVASLPLFFRHGLSSFPQQESYIVPDKQQVEIWRERFKAEGAKVTVGISWRGGFKALAKKIRSIPLAAWESILSIQGVYFVNLQYGNCVEDISSIKESFGVTVHDWDDGDPLKDLDGFAARISALDLVISVDNSTVHMAGALGKPVWALLPSSCEWRWMQSYEDTPWYKSLRFFRQSGPDDWEGVLNRVASDLKKLVCTGAMPEIDTVNSYKYSIRNNQDTFNHSAPLINIPSDRKFRCAVITPVGPGHEKLYDACLSSINESYNNHNGRFSEITCMKVDDLEGNLGRSKARNSGIKQAADWGADWLFFLDADDLMAAETFEHMSFYLESHDAVWGSIWAIDSENQTPLERPGQLPFLYSIEDVLSADPAGTLQMGHFVKTSIAVSTPFNESLDTGEDFDYYLRVWKQYKCIKVPLPFFYNRRGLHSTGPKSADGLQWRTSVEKTIKEYRKTYCLTSF